MYEIKKMYYPRYDYFYLVLSNFKNIEIYSKGLKEVLQRIYIV